jgi:8-oxo-dGTP pyrophosphatase MutT (NUDIX family)
VYKNVGGSYKILLVARAEDERHWQLPQGGLDNLDVKSAGVKELTEELNLPAEKFAVHAVIKNLYKYTFDKGLGKFKNPKQHYGYKGQSQSLVIAEFLGGLDEPKINFWDHQAYKWVDANNLINEVHELRQPSAKIYLEKFKELI